VRLVENKFVWLNICGTFPSVLPQQFRMTNYISRTNWLSNGPLYFCCEMSQELLAAAVVLENSSNTHVINIQILPRLKIVLNVLTYSLYLVSTCKCLAACSVFY
jgi:hypothetical protein